MKRVFIALVFAVSPAAHTVHSQTLQKLATYQGEDRQQRLVEGARKEGSLLFYATFPIEYADQLIEPFRSKYGIRVDVTRDETPILALRPTTVMSWTEANYPETATRWTFPG